jgi:hypothetical protein
VTEVLRTPGFGDGQRANGVDGLVLGLLGSDLVLRRRRRAGPARVALERVLDPQEVVCEEGVCRAGRSTQTIFECTNACTAARSSSAREKRGSSYSRWDRSLILACKSCVVASTKRLPCPVVSEPAQAHVSGECGARAAGHADRRGRSRCSRA